MPELQASITVSFEGVQVVWLRSVVDYWEKIEPRWNDKISLSLSYAFEISLHAGHQ